MSWAEYAAARQLVAEERVGRLVREAQVREDLSFSAARAALTK